MSSTKQKWYKRLAVVMLALFATVWLGSPFAVFADNDATPTDATDTIPKDLFYYVHDIKDDYTGFFYHKHDDGFLILGKCNSDSVYNDYVKDDIISYLISSKATPTYLKGTPEEIIDQYKDVSNEWKNIQVVDFNIFDTVYIYSLTDKSLVAELKSDTITKYSVLQKDGQTAPDDKGKDDIISVEDWENNDKINVTNYTTQFVKDDNDFITGVSIDCTTDKLCNFVETFDLPYTVNRKSNTNFIITVDTMHDATVTIHVKNDLTPNSANILTVNLTGIDAHNDALIDDTLPEIDYTDLDVVFEGVPAKGTYNEGQDVTLTMKATTPSELFFDGDEVVAPFGKESTVTVSKNGSYLYSAKAENGQLKSGVLEVTWFNYVDDDGNPIPDEDSPNSDKHQTWTWEERQNPWTHYTDAADNYLVQTGIYEKGNSVPTLAIIWVSIISVIVVGGFIYYKKGVKRNEEK